MSSLIPVLRKIKSFFLSKNHVNSYDRVDLSFSRIQTYQRCPWMYHLVYALGWRSGPNSGMALGMSLHRTLAVYHSSATTQKTLDRLHQIFDEQWVNQGFNSTQETLDAYDKGRKMLEQFFQSDLHRSSEVFETEKEFEVQLENNVRFHGTIDRLDKYNDGSYEVVEYKTQGHHWTESRMETDLQMTLYEIGMKKLLGGKPLKLKYHFLSTGESVPVQRTPDQLNSAHDLINRIAQRIRTKDFSPNKDYCPKCEFGNRCVYNQKKPS